MAQQLHAVAALAENSGSVPSTHTEAHNHLNSSSKGSNTHFDLCGRQTCSGCPYIHIGKTLNHGK